MFGGKARQYPYLTTYLSAVTDRPELGQIATPMGAIVGFLAVSAGLTLVQSGLFGAIGLVVAALVGLGLFIQYKKRQPVPTAEDLRREEAHKVAKTMRQCLDLRRLHRDLDEGSLILLDECARHWEKIRTTFTTGFWTDRDLPPAYLSARRTAMDAADDAMVDLLILFRPLLPSEVQSRQALDYVEEAIETYVVKGPLRPSHVPPAFYEAREIAEKLRELSSESEKMARNIDREQIRTTNPSSSSLEASLSEIRAIRQAEDELRQNLHG